MTGLVRLAQRYMAINKMKNIILLTIIIIIGGNCIASSRRDKSIEFKTNHTSQITFTAVLTKVEIGLNSKVINKDYKYNIDGMTKESKVKELVIGFDANYMIEMQNIQYLENKIGIAKSDLLRCYIHSPTLTFGSNHKIGTQYEFAISYSTESPNIVSFVFMTAKEKQ